ncbi:MAG: phenylalanine--tRNA ligase subunit alpha, partial [Planctomycetota bacterium]
MLEKIDELKTAAEAELAEAKAKGGDALEAFRVRYLGSKGRLKALMGLMKEVPKDQKRAFGQGANALKGALQEAFEGALSGAGDGKPAGASSGLTGVDVTEPG